MMIMLMMPGSMPCVSAAYWIKRRGNFVDRGAKPDQHRLDDMVTQDQDFTIRDSRRQVTVADMPCELNEMGLIMRCDFVERLVGGGNSDDVAVIEYELIS